MIEKNHLCGINNYCKCSHTMTMRVNSKTSAKGMYRLYLNCLEGNCFENDKFNPNFMYNKWLIKE